MPRHKPILARLETQAHVTLTLLPFVAALPFLSDEMLVRLFGQSMATLNWTQSIREAMQMPPYPPLPPFAPMAVKRRTLTREEQRAYWREAKRAERQRKKKRA